MSQKFGGNLHARRNASTSSHHVEVLSGVLLAINGELTVLSVMELTNGTAHVQGITNLEAIQILAHLSTLRESLDGFVRLNDELYTANVIITGDGGVATQYRLSIDCCAEEHVLSSWQTQDVFLGGEGKIQQKGVVAEHDLVLQNKGRLLSRVECELASRLGADSVVVLRDSSSGCGGIGVQVSNVVLLQHLGGLDGVDGDEIFRRVLTLGDQDRVLSTGMEFKVFGTIVYSVIDDDEHPFFLLLDLLPGEFGSTGCAGFGSNRLGLSIVEGLKQTPVSRSIWLIADSRHPTTSLLTGLSGVFKLEGGSIWVDLNAEALVVAHSHKVPCGFRGLSHVGSIPGAAPDLLSSNEVCHLELVLPPDPAPVHSVLGRLLLPFNLTELPVNATIQTNFNTGDHTSATGVSVSSHGEFLGNILSQINHLIVVGTCNGTVNVQLIENVFWLVPPSSGQTLLTGNLWRQNTVVVVVVVILGFEFEDIDLSEPLNHAAANVSRNDETDGETVIGLELLAVGLVRDDDVICRVHGTSQGDASSVLDELTPLSILEGSRSDLVGKVFHSYEFNVLSIHVHVIGDAHLLEEMSHRDSFPHVGGNSTGSPVESNGLTEHILFLSAVTSTNKCNRKLTLGHIHQIIHASH
mmetsp:Transcript_17454/g.27181  ORF Transcript_17454/g.27181 Transcript_17454/m.27181 type:complete len:636 (+) Transcript_17454:561-2468(+)